ncbi:MAG: FAD-binding oxidoreductase [Pirellulales bacterium]
MIDVGDMLPLTALVEPASQEELVAQLRGCYESTTPCYPIGGGTSLDYGLPGRLPGIGLRLTALNRVVDYPARDMTVTVEAGITMAALTAELARHAQRLPVDAGDADRATLGGMIATNTSGPRRYGYGTLRDYVIGISAVDGRGTPFKAGGRVVKNVAGYDLCKLLTGSLGTLAVITQVTLKVRPLPEATAFLACDLSDWQQAEAILAALVCSRTTPVAIEIVRGPRWSDVPCRAGDDSLARVLVGFEGNRVEVKWQIEQLRRELRENGVATAEEYGPEAAGKIWDQLIAFGRPGSPLVVKANLRPSAVTAFLQTLMRVDCEVSLQSHAGNGIIIAELPNFTAADAGRILVQTLQPAAVASGGNVVVWSCAAGELTRQATWGVAASGAELMRAVKQQFDPKGLLNPGRFVYGVA